MPFAIDTTAIPRLCVRIDALGGRLDGLAECLLGVRDALAASTICLGSVVRGGDQILKWTAPEADPEICEFYNRDGYPWSQNPWARIVNSLPIGELMRTELAGPRPALKRTEYYDIFIRRFDILETLGFRLFDGPKESMFVGVFRSERRGRFDAAAERAACMLFGSLHRFARLGAEVELLRGPPPEAVLVHELRRRGVVLTTRQARVFWLSYVGRRDKEIAGELGISIDRVKRILRDVRDRLGVERTKDALRLLSGIAVADCEVGHDSGK